MNIQTNSFNSDIRCHILICMIEYECDDELLCRLVECITKGNM